MITVADLKEQTDTPEPRPVLHCFACGEDFSANKGDYFNRPETYPFFCCDKPMELATKRVVYEPVPPSTKTSRSA